MQWGMLLLGILWLPGLLQAQSIERVSVAADGGGLDAPSLQSRSNGDGSLVVFLSAASNVVANDRNEKNDVFVLDLNNHTSQRVSLSFLGRDPNDNSFPAVISRDGRIVAFGSAASNIVTGDFNTVPDVFVYDRDAQRTEVISLARNGLGGGAVPDLPPAITPEGRFVAFASQADDLVANDDNQASDLFVYDRENDTIEVLTYTSIGSPQTRTANGPSAGPAISADGCVVAFYSDAGNLVMGDTNQLRDVFVRDRCTGQIERISISSDEAEANGPSQVELAALTMSADARFVVFASRATNLDALDSGGLTNLYVRDRATGTTRLISKNANGEAANAATLAPSMTADGRFVVFQSAATNLVDTDNNGKVDIFVVDLLDGELRLVSHASDGAPADGDSFFASISDDGARVVFQSTAHLTPDDANNVADTYSVENPLYFKLFDGTPTPTETQVPSATPETDTATPTAPRPSATASPTGTVRFTVTASVTARPPTVAQSPTATATLRPGATLTPTVQGATATASMTLPTATTARSSGGGGGGCGCRIDPATGRLAYDDPWPAALLPIVLWLARRQRRSLAA